MYTKKIRKNRHQEGGAVWNYLPTWAQRFRRKPVVAEPSFLRLTNNLSATQSIKPDSVLDLEVNNIPSPSQVALNPTNMFKNTPRLPNNYPQIPEPVMARRPVWNIFDVTRKRRQKQYANARRQRNIQMNLYRTTHPEVGAIERRLRNIKRQSSENNARALRYMKQYELAEAARRPFPRQISHYEDIPFESISAAKQRGLIFFYNQMHTKSEGPGKGYEFQEGYIPVNFNKQSELTDAQRRELQAAISQFDLTNPDFELIAESVFHLPLEELNRKLKVFEKISPVLYEFTEREVKPQAWGSYLERYMDTFFYTSRDFEISEDVGMARHKCAFRRVPGSATPITNFASTRNSEQTACIIIFSSLMNLQWYIKDQDFSNIGQRFTTPFIVIDYNKLDITLFKRHTTTPYTVEPENFLENTIIRDAFNENAVLAIEPALENVLSREAAELIQNKDEFVDMFSLDNYGYINLLKINANIRNARVDDLRFVISSAALPHVPSIYTRFPEIFITDTYLKQNSGTVLFCDAFTLYRWRSQLLENNEARELYEKSFGIAKPPFQDPNLETYRNQMPNVQAVICYLQYAAGIQQYSMILTQNRNKFTKAITNKNRVKSDYIHKYAILLAGAIYTTPLTNDRLVKTIYELFANPTSSFLAGLLRFQQRIFGEAVIQTPQDIRNILGLFNASFGQNILESAIPFEEAVAANVETSIAKAAKTRGERVAALRARYEIPRGSSATAVRRLTRGGKTQKRKRYQRRAQ